MTAHKADATGSELLPNQSDVHHVSGSPGSGKSHCAQAIGHAVIQQGYRVLYREAHRTRALILLVAQNSLARCDVDHCHRRNREWRASKSRGSSGSGVGVACNDDQPSLLQAPDSTGFSPSCEPDGYRPGRGLRSDQSAGVQRHCGAILGRDGDLGYIFRLHAQESTAFAGRHVAAEVPVMNVRIEVVCA
jgi:hypothetical protein